MSKESMRQEIKALRFQMNNLENSCKEREDRMYNLIMKLEPFLNSLDEDKRQELIHTIDEEFLYD